MKKAIVVYIDNNDNLLEEFTWLWKTWNMWKLSDEFDIVAYCNPLIISKMPSHENLIIKPLEPISDTDSFWKNYKFVNSFAMFNDINEVKWMQSKYTHILKTDADVFLTEHIKGLTPNTLLVGRGGYMNNENTFEEIRSNISRLHSKFELTDRGYNHIGASLFGETNTVLHIVRQHFVITRKILETEWIDGDGKWPGWCKGVSSMYAIHLLINHYMGSQSLSLYSLDSLCWNNLIDSNTYHIHAWHGGDFSKHKWFKGEYNKLESKTVPVIAKEYCQWIASNTLEELINTISI